MIEEITCLTTMLSPLQVTDDMLRSALHGAGFVWELVLPRNAEGALPLAYFLSLPSQCCGAADIAGSEAAIVAAGKPRGFAFAGFTCRAHAEKAIVLVNGQVHTNTCCSEVVTPPQPPASKLLNKICWFLQKLSGRVVAVDWAISKADFQRAEAGAFRRSPPQLLALQQDISV